MSERGMPLRLLGLALLMLAWDLSGWDRLSLSWVGSSAGFAGRHHPLLAQGLHDGGRLLSALAVLATAWACLAPEFGHGRRGASSLDRGERAIWLSGLLLTLLLVPMLKQLSSTSCPWSLAEFGGTAHWVSHWDWLHADGGPGHCFPSGHAAGAFAHLATVWAWQRRQPQRARRLLALVLTTGLLFGLAQWLRGAHAPSHSLWSAWLCAALSWGWQAFWSAWRTRRVAQPGPQQLQNSST